MSRFFVGQRVRHVKSLTGKIPVGAEGVIVEICPGFITLDSTVADARVLWAGISHPKMWSAFWQLEPILPEGHKPCEEDFKRDLDRLLEREGVSA